jgi:stalled ribosome rescue protein Dom34
MKAVPDIVDEAVAAAIDQNCEVFHIAPGCGLKELGGIGALLRYKGGMQELKVA